MSHGFRQALLDALVKGLTASGRGDDQLIAFDLIMRLTVEKPAPLSIALALLGRLPTSSEGVQFHYFLDLLRSLPAGPETGLCYDTAIATLVSSMDTQVEVGRLSSTSALGCALELYKDMIFREMTPTTRSISLLIRALYQAEHLVSARKVVDASMDAGLDIDSDTIGRLIIRLGEEARFDEADSIGQRWKEVMKPDMPQSGRGLIGASVILDTMRGREVDLRNVAKKGGWAGPNTLLSFLKTLDTRRGQLDLEIVGRAGGASTEQPHISAQVAIAQLERQSNESPLAVTMSSEKSIIGIPPSSRRRIPRLRTVSQSDTRWHEEDQGEKGVDLVVVAQAGLAGT